ncbi:MAG: hypothetical protein KA015_04210 [Spirochaetes bacterium]|nr:hypothetical protein [Spirochaetota bacterium]
MKKVISIFAFVLCAGCVSAPDKIDDSLLIEKTPEQAQKIESLEDRIIEQNKVLEKSITDLNNSKQDLLKEKGVLSILEKEKSLNDEKLKVAKASKDEEAVSAAQNELKLTDSKISKQTVKLAYVDSLNAHRDNSNRLESAKLNVLVAELNYEKAKIARAYQVKQLKNKKTTDAEAKKEKSFFDNFKKNKDGLIDEEEYRKYFDSIKDDVQNRTADWKITEEKMNKAKSGYDESLR